jgi:hypothetical protein
MKTIIITLLFALSAILSAAQGCLPEGITFETQAQIENFPYDYPGCTVIEGDVTICDSSPSDITNLKGLSIVTSIGGDLVIYLNDSLESLKGLNALSAVGGDFYLGYYDWCTGYIIGNPSLTSLKELAQLNFIGGELHIMGNSALTSLAGLVNLDSIGGGIYIHNNMNLTDCAVQSICDYLRSPNGIVEIYDNSSGCSNQSQVASGCGGTFPGLPYGNYYFFSQDEIDNFPVIFPGCNELGGTVTISGLDITNLNGFDQVTSIGGALQIGQYHYFSGEGNPLLTDLTGLENLTYIGGDLWINMNNSMTSLAGLDNLAAINGGLLIGLTYVGGDNRGLPVLANITALSKLTSIGGRLYIEQTALTNLSGLESLNSIGDGLYLNDNHNLSSITSLENMQSIGGAIWIWSSDLNSLSGLENIDPGSITSLSMEYNYSLSDCEVQSICDYLASPDAYVNIDGNAPGCNSREEVEAACTVGLGESAVGGQRSAVRNYPNPFSDFTTIEYELECASHVNLSIFNHLGQQFAVLANGEQAAGKQQVLWDAEGLPAGVYYFRLTTNDQRPTTETGKIVKY